MNRKFQILIDALNRVMSSESNMQEYFDFFMTGRLPLFTESGIKLNPYDYIGKTGKRLIRFQSPSQEIEAARLNGASKKVVGKKPRSPQGYRTVQQSPEQLALKKELAGIQQRLRKVEETMRQNQYLGLRIPHQDGTRKCPVHGFQSPRAVDNL